MNLHLLICLLILNLNNFCVNSAIIKGDLDSKENVSNICLTQECIETAALISTSIDDTVDPCDDFYDYACGNWLKEHFVPPNASYGYSLADKMVKKISDILSYELNKGYRPDQPKALKRLYNFYNTCIDLESRDKAGLNDLKYLIEKLGGWSLIDSNWKPDNYSWEDAYVKFNYLRGLSYPISLYVMDDFTNTTQNKILLFASPYSLLRQIELRPNGYFPEHKDPIDIFPNFDIFDDKLNLLENITSEIKGSSVNHTEFIQLTNQVNLFEAKLKNITTNLTIKESPNDYVMNNYDKLIWTVDKLRNVTPDINWDKIFMGFFGRTNITGKVLVVDTKFAYHINDVIKEMDKRTLAHAFALQTISLLISYTTQKYQKQFTSWPIEKICLGISEEIFANLISKLYLNHIKFDKNIKTDIEDMVKLIKENFEKLLDANEWMDPVTKKLAKEKLLAIHTNAVAQPIVFNDEQLEKDHVEFGDMKESHLLNMVNGLSIQQKRDYQSYLDKHKNTWPSNFDLATVVDAFYQPIANGIFLPAGIGQMPFYGKNRPISANLGFYGTVIGHELTHAFDDSGAKFDLNGQYLNWWTNDTLKKFETKSQCFVSQYSKFNVTEVNQFIDGKRTLGENIADNGGIREAFYTMQNYKKQSKVPIQKFPGDLSSFSDEKIFFLSYAMSWCENDDKARIKSSLNYDVHSPPHARVVLPLANFDQFAKTYNCPVNSKMNPKDKCVVW